MLHSFHGIRLLRSPRNESSEGYVIDDLFALLQVVFESVEAFPQIVILEIEKAKTGIEVADEFGDGQRTLVVTSGHAVQSVSGEKSIEGEIVGYFETRQTALSQCLSVCLSVCVYWSICLSVCLSITLSV